MSVKSVQKAITQAMRKPDQYANADVTQEEAKAIVSEASKNGVTKSEGKEVGQFFEKGIVQRPGMAFTEMAPEIGQENFYMDEPTEAVFAEFFVQHNLPYGNTVQQTMAFPENGGDDVQVDDNADVGNDGPPMMTLAIPENGDDNVAIGNDGPPMMTLAIPENGGDDTQIKSGGGQAMTLAIPENGVDDAPRMMTMAFPENGGDNRPPMMMTMAIPENP